MNHIFRLITRLYAALLRLYPEAFRAEYGPEQQGVFAALVEDSLAAGWLALSRLCLRELRDLPGNLIREYYLLLYRKEMTMKPTSAPKSALLGAIGFGLGLTILMVGRWILDPNSVRQSSLLGILGVDLVLYMLMGAAGGALLGSSLPGQNMFRMALGGLAGCLAGGMVADAFIYSLYHAYYQSWGATSFPVFTLIRFSGIAFMGASIGGGIGLAQRDVRQALRLAQWGGIGWGLSSLISVPISIVVRTALALPPQIELSLGLVLLTALPSIGSGIISGGILGWGAGRQHRQAPHQFAADA